MSIAAKVDCDGALERPLTEWARCDQRRRRLGRRRRRPCSHPTGTWCPTSRSLHVEFCAIHEAGHAVADVAAGFKVELIELHPDGHPDQPDVGGITHIGPQKTDLTTYLTTLWAGQAAQLRYLSGLQLLTDHYQGLVAAACHDDRAVIDEVIHEAGATAQHAELSAAARQLADRLMADHWDVVRQVASLLLAADNYRLDGEEVHRLCRPRMDQLLTNSTAHDRQPSQRAVMEIPCRRWPCRECPWRRDVPPGQFDAGRYDALAVTVGGPGREVPVGGADLRLPQVHRGQRGRVRRMARRRRLRASRDAPRGHQDE